METFVIHINAIDEENKAVVETGLVNIISENTLEVCIQFLGESSHVTIDKGRIRLLKKYQQNF